MRCVNSEHIVLPIFLLRYGSHGQRALVAKFFFPEAARCAFSGLPNRKAL